MIYEISVSRREEDGNVERYDRRKSCKGKDGERKENTEAMRQ
jgi:hypothetical protein